MILSNIILQLKWLIKKEFSCRAIDQHILEWTARDSVPSHTVQENLREIIRSKLGIVGYKGTSIIGPASYNCPWPPSD